MGGWGCKTRTRDETKKRRVLKTIDFNNKTFLRKICRVDRTHNVFIINFFNHNNDSVRRVIFSDRQIVIKYSGNVDVLYYSLIAFSLKSYLYLF